MKQEQTTEIATQDDELGKDSVLDRLLLRKGAGNSHSVDEIEKKSRTWQVIGFISAVFTVLCLIWLSYIVSRSSQFITGTSELQVLSQQIANNAEAATSAAQVDTSSVAFKTLRQKQAKFNEVLKTTLANQPITGSSITKDINNQWMKINKNVDVISQRQAAISQLYDLSANVNDSIPLIQAQYNDAVNRMLGLNVRSEQVLLAKNQVILAERILRAINTLVSGAQGQTTDDFIADTEQFAQVLNAQLEGNNFLNIDRINVPEVRERLNNVEAAYEGLSASVMDIAKNAQPAFEAKGAALEIQKDNQVLTDTLQDIDTTVFGDPAVWFPALLLLLSFLAAVYSVLKILQLRNEIETNLSIRESERQLREAEEDAIRAKKIQEENERNQMAILRLLDELGDLADGDLTTNATVTEDFTGAIADSVNYAIDQLRLLVSAINDTSANVARSSDDTRSTAVELAEASEHQAQEIAGASAAINEMAVSIDQVSANAAESAAVADRSVSIAYKGADVVNRTIEGMNTIRDQIQETSKRIKRLGESSQEIGDIIGLINDIADQTNILALNAAIQASMAGEAGRGFAVVADEVQRLAERSANATKQIETLVKTIQADTNEAVSSMESTTAEVVKGARLAKDAGEALNEVQAVSNNLAELIQNISSAARQQASSAGHISKTMNIIQDITSQTTAGTMATARSVGQLNDMAISLQESVSGFKLPDDDFDKGNMGEA